MHFKIDRPGSLDAYFSGIRDLLPAVDALISRYPTTKLRDYVASLGRERVPALQDHRDFVAAVADYTRATLGPELGAAVAAELEEFPQVLTANHHGIDTFAQSTQSNLLFSLRRRADGSPAQTIPVLACGSVPLNNLTYPRGLLVYACNDSAGAGGICRLPVFPDRCKRQLVSAAEPFTAEMLARTRLRAKKLIDGDRFSTGVGPALEAVFEDLDRVGHAFPGYARQATAVNRRLWRRLFRGRAAGSELVYIELESVACRLLEHDLFDRSTILHQLLFDPDLRRPLIEKLDGQRGCWQSERLSRRCATAATGEGADSAMGTMFFWGVDAKSRQVPLRVVESSNGAGAELRGTDDGGNAWCVPLDPDEIARGLRDRRLLPSIFTSYLQISIARGVGCIGGYYQADYLPVMRAAVGEILGKTLAKTAGARPDPYLSGMQAVGFRIGDRLLPAGPVEIIACGGLDDDQYERIGDVTVWNAHVASLLDFVIDLVPGSHDIQRLERDVSKLVHDRVGDEILTISLERPPGSA